MEPRFQQPHDWQWGKITAAQGITLRTGSLERHEKPVANLIIGPGMREFTEKYWETIRDFSDRGYNIYFINWMGQGGSDSILPGRFHRNKSFNYFHDAQSLIDYTKQYVPDNAPKVYIGHSTGGLIGLLALVKSPKIFAATALLAPFLGFFDKRAKFLEATLKFLNLKPKHMTPYIPGGRDWLLRSDAKNSMKAEDYSIDAIRKGLHDQWTSANPHLRLGDLTRGGFHEACQAIASLEKPGIAETVKTPTLLVSGGKEKLVNIASIFNMATRIPNALHTHIEKSRHETLMESDDIRKPLIAEIDGFFRARLG